MIGVWPSPLRRDGWRSRCYSLSPPSSWRRLFILEQTGRIKIYDGTQVLATPFLDLSSLITCCGERGLLGLAFAGWSGAGCSGTAPCVVTRIAG